MLQRKTGLDVDGGREELYSRVRCQRSYSCSHDLKKCDERSIQDKEEGFSWQVQWPRDGRSLARGEKPEK